MAGSMTKSALKLARLSLKIAQSSLPAYTHKFVSPEGKVKRLSATCNTSFFPFWYCVNFLKPTIAAWSCCWLNGLSCARCWAKSLYENCFPVDKKVLATYAFLTI